MQQVDKKSSTWTPRGARREKSSIYIYIYIYMKGAAAPPAAGPFNSTLHTGDPILGLNVFALLQILLLGVQWNTAFQLRIYS
jgi:hypothetical protein